MVGLSEYCGFFAMKFLAVVCCLTALVFGRSFGRTAKTLTSESTPDVVVTSKHLANHHGLFKGRYYENQPNTTTSDETADALSASFANRQELWQLFKGLIPNEYHDLVVQQELYENTEFQRDVFKLALKQMSIDVQTQIAKQEKLREFVLCSCPKSTCQNITHELDDFRQELNPFFQEVESARELESALKTLRLLKFCMNQIQRRYQQLVLIVHCSCRNAEQCRETLPPQMYDIISGKNDNFIRNAYWQDALQESPIFPKILSPGLYRTLQTAWSNLLEGFFGNVVPPSWGWFGQANKNRTQTGTQSGAMSSAELNLEEGAEKEEVEQDEEEDVVNSGSVNYQSQTGPLGHLKISTSATTLESSDLKKTTRPPSVLENT